MHELYLPFNPSNNTDVEVKVYSTRNTIRADQEYLNVI